MSRPLRIAAISYPFLFQTIGGLQIQILETVEALNRAGQQMRLIDSARERFTDFDLVHVFAAVHGNHKVVQQAADLGVPVVLSTLVPVRWTRWLRWRADLADRLTGRLTGWRVKTEYGQIKQGTHLASRCVALGAAERDSLHVGYGVPLGRIDVVPNGIPARFFAADGSAARQHFTLGDRDFVLCVGSIDANKNQLGLARALHGTGRELVLVGQCMPANQSYLEQVLALPRTRYVGSLAYEDPLLASLFAAAQVFCLASLSEVMPLVVLEALAAGTPVVMTRHHAMDLSGIEAVVRQVEPRDDDAIRSAVAQMASSGPAAEACRAAVAHLSWDAVAQRLLETYRLAVKPGRGEEIL